MKIGVLGVGHLGKIHIKCIKDIDRLNLVGFYDPDQNNASIAIKEYGVKRFDNIEDLIKSVDIVDIITPTLSHFNCASMALKLGKHVFIEKPLTSTIEEAKELIALTTEANTKVQVGHVERFNPAFLAAAEYITCPMFIETHRLASFNPRGTDVSVILDLMIHDIDIILSLVKSNIKKISASGVAVVSNTPDICNARIEFDNGCVANLTASRISIKNMRKSRFFQRDAYIAVDFLDKNTKVFRLKNIVGEPNPLAITIDLGNNKGFKEIYFESPEVAPINSIQKEIEALVDSIQNNTPTRVTINDGYKALEVAYKILEKVEITGNNQI